MSDEDPSPGERASRLASLGPGAARAILVGLIALGLFGSFGTPPEDANPRLAGRDIDANLYRAVVERVHGGEGYYDSAGTELRARGFATRPFWNWRLPTLAWSTARLPVLELSRVLLGAASLAGLLLWIPLLRHHVPLAAALAGGILIAGALVSAGAEHGFLFHEVWAGVFIALSLAAWGLGHVRLAVVAGLLALFVRELALPYVGVMAALAWVEGRRREAVAWAAGLALFAVALGLHGWIVAQHLGEGEIVNESWVRFGGWSFVLATARWNAFLLPAPEWVAAWVLPLALLGLVGWRAPVGARAALTLGAYVLAYAVAGRADNTYWGLIYAPLLPVGLVFAPAALAALWRRALPQAT